MVTVAAGHCGSWVAGHWLTISLTRHTSEGPEPNCRPRFCLHPATDTGLALRNPPPFRPTGKFLAVIAMRNGHTQLWLRRLDATEMQSIAGSESAANPFWSPDSRYIAFFVPGKLKKVDISGGTVSDICPAGTFGMGGAWSPRGIIVFSTFAAGLKRVPDSGGTPEPIAGVELSSDALGQQWPAFLPDGKHFLYLEWRYPAHDSHDDGVWIGSLDGEKARRLPLTSTNAQYSAGYLLFSWEGDLVAQKFNLSRLELSGAELINEALHPDLKLRFSCFQHNEAGIILEMFAAMLRCGAYQ